MGLWCGHLQTCRKLPVPVLINSKESLNTLCHFTDSCINARGTEPKVEVN